MEKMDVEMREKHCLEGQLNMATDCRLREACASFLNLKYFENVSIENWNISWKWMGVILRTKLPRREARIGQAER